MSTVVASPSASSSSGLASGVSAWFTPGHWMACLRGRLRTAFKPRVVYVQADPSAMEPAWAGVAQSFAAWCAGHVGERCVVGLSSHGLLHALVDADLNEQDAVAQAVQQWAHYMDVDAASLQADWLLRRVTVGGRHLVSAAPMALIHALLDGAQAHGVRLSWVGPWWARGAQSWLCDLRGSGGDQPDASEATWMLEAREPGLVTRIEAGAVPGQALHLQRLWMEADNGASATASAVSVRLASPQQLGIACDAHHAHVWDQDQLRPLLQGEPTAWGGQAMKRRLQHMMSPPQWAQELDFVGPRISPSPWSWLLLLLGLVALGVVLPQVQEVAAQEAEAQATLKRLQRAVHQQTLAAKAPKALAQKADQAPTLSPDAARHAAQMAQWLGYPWLGLLSQVEEAAQAEQAVMLGFNLDLATLGSRPDSAPDVHLSAAVRDDASALRWVQAQGSVAQLLSRERLGTPFVAAAGNYEWRAEAVLSGVSP